MLNGLTEFDIIPEYKIRGTTFWVRVPGSDNPVARIRRDVGVTGSVGGLHRVFVGPNLDEFAGFVTPTGAYDASRTKVGSLTVDDSGYATLEKPVVFCQENMEPLTEHASGLMGRIMRLPLMGYLVYFLNPVVVMAGMLVGARRAADFRSAHSPGFRMAKVTRVKNHFRFSISDPRIDVLLVFSCFLVAHSSWGYLNPKKSLTSTVSAFDPKSWKGPRALAVRS
ncbi:hypothetical protein [Nocardia vaccinii]|uniref:hypothetical protein n=1 Tax=Nocardia vaccinii TaxID=1822 RepID=UPI00083273E2|nr:hypothetical protein [Nocardia vaccinii]